MLLDEVLEQRLRKVDGLMRDSLGPWAAPLEEYCREAAARVHWRMLPASVLCAHDLAGAESDYSLRMATMFRLVDLAGFIHGTVRDDSEGQEYDQRLQFAILVGDYIFGLVLRLLGDIDAYDLLPVLAAMMCEINEGRALRCVEGRREASLPVLEKEVATLYRHAFLVASLACGLPEREQRAFAAMGHALGVEFALRQEAQAAGMHVQAEEANAALLMRELQRVHPLHSDKVVSQLLGGTVERKVAVG